MRHTNSVAPANLADGVIVEFLRLPSVMRRTSLGRSTIYRLVAEHKFPSPVKLAGRAIGWRRTDLDRWSDALPEVRH